jgi:hypothetical protein
MKTKQVGDFFMKSNPNPKTSRKQPEQLQNGYPNEQNGSIPNNNINGVKASKNIHNSDPQLPNMNARNKNYHQNGNFDDYSLNTMNIGGGGGAEYDYNFNDYNLNNFKNVSITGSYDQNNHYHPPTTINSNKNSKI